MTPSKIIEIADKYYYELAPGLQPRKEDKPTVLHLKYMCLEINHHVKNGKIEKAMRWLGFIQGVLCAKGIYKISDLKNHNRK